MKKIIVLSVSLASSLFFQNCKKEEAQNVIPANGSMHAYVDGSLGLLLVDKNGINLLADSAGIKKLSEDNIQRICFMNGKEVEYAKYMEEVYNRYWAKPYALYLPENSIYCPSCPSSIGIYLDVPNGSEETSYTYYRFGKNKPLTVFKTNFFRYKGEQGLYNGVIAKQKVWVNDKLIFDNDVEKANRLSGIKSPIVQLVID